MMNIQIADGVVTIDGVEYRKVEDVEYRNEDDPPVRELGEPWTPEVGAVYYAPSPFTGSGTYEYRWDDDDVDRRARDRHLIAETEAEAAAMTARAALHERARRVRADIWAEEPCYLGPHVRHYPNADGSITEHLDGALPTPWHFGTNDGAERFVSALAPDLRALLGGEGDV